MNDSCDALFEFRSKYPRNCLVDQVCAYDKVVDPDTALGKTK